MHAIGTRIQMRTGETGRMAGEEDTGELKSQDCSFVWDEKTQLYFHASSGFYHDPIAGWYYSSRDALYYKFEDGNYVLMESNKLNQCQIYPCEAISCNYSDQDESYKNVCLGCNENSFLPQEDEFEACSCMRTVHNELCPGQAECSTSQTPKDPLPPSEWLEDTLIDLYLSDYNQVANAAADTMMSSETDDGNNFKLSANGESDKQELEEGEWIPEDHRNLNDLSGEILDEGSSRDEEAWKAQYGQVIQSLEEPVREFPVVDLWDWAVVTVSGKKGKGQAARLVGRLGKRSTKFHPSVPSGGSLRKTAPICEVHVDLVRVTTGQVYRLRRPCGRYLASLSTYDSSNPTREWGFPELSVNCEISPFPKSNQKGKSKKANVNASCKGSTTLPDQLYAPEKQRSHAYRDRAAERRSLHGVFGVGPGQKSMVVDNVGGQFSSLLRSTEEAADMSFGACSYARKILKSMGWKEGEALGNTTKGLVEPVQAVGNNGNAGIGWPSGRTVWC